MFTIRRILWGKVYTKEYELHYYDVDSNLRCNNVNYNKYFI